jgi:hypothetical protein
MNGDQAMRFQFPAIGAIVYSERGPVGGQAGVFDGASADENTVTVSGVEYYQIHFPWYHGGDRFYVAGPPVGIHRVSREALFRAIRFEPELALHPSVAETLGWPRRIGYWRARAFLRNACGRWDLPHAVDTRIDHPIAVDTSTYVFAPITKEGKLWSARAMGQSAIYRRNRKMPFRIFYSIGLKEKAKLA